MPPWVRSAGTVFADWSSRVATDSLSKSESAVDMMSSRVDLPMVMLTLHGLFCERTSNRRCLVRLVGDLSVCRRAANFPSFDWPAYWSKVLSCYVTSLSLLHVNGHSCSRAGKTRSRPLCPSLDCLDALSTAGEPRPPSRQGYL